MGYLGNKILLSLVAIAFLLAGCSPTQDQSVKTTVADPSDSTGQITAPVQYAGQETKKIVTHTWPVENQTLIERTEGSFTKAYFLGDGNDDKMIGSAIYNLEFQEYAKGKLYFIGHSENDGALITFPYTFWYDMNSEATGVEKAYLRTDEESFWGQRGQGHLLKDMAIKDNAVSFSFGIKDELAAVSSINYFPFTSVSYNSGTNELTFCIYQTEAVMDTNSSLETFHGNDYFSAITMEQRTTGLAISENDLPWWLHAPNLDSVVNYPAVVIKVKPTKLFKYTLQDNSSTSGKNQQFDKFSSKFTLEFSKF